MGSGFIPLFVVIPLAAALLIPLCARLWQRSAELIANAAGAALLGLSAYGAVRLFTDSPALVYRLGGWVSPLGVTLVYDHLTALVALAVSVVGLAALLFSVRYLDGCAGCWKFFSLFMLVIAGLNGVTITGDVFTMFLFIEISAVSFYMLAAFGPDVDKPKARYNYVVLSEVGGVAILLAVALLYVRASTFNIGLASQVMARFGHTHVFWLIVAIFLVGFAVKMAAVPFHAWLAAAHRSALAPVSALLSGAIVEVLGVYAMMRVMFNVFGLSRANAPTFFNLLLAFGVLSIVAGGLLAYAQKDYKRLLAYSGISQIGYILIGLGIGNYWAIVGALFHVLAQAPGNGVLFLTAGSIERATGTRDMDKLSGLEEKMPVTAWSYLLGSLSLAGVPPFAGFFSKLFIIIGAVSAKMYWLAILAALFSTVTLGYFIRLVNKAFFSRPPSSVLRPPSSAREAPATMVLAMLALLVLTVALGIGFKPMVDKLVGPAAKVLLNGLGYARTVLGG